MTNAEFPLLSIVVPCRDEQDHIRACLDSIARSDYPLDRIDAIVVDGMSTDQTRPILSHYSGAHGFVRMLDNPAGTIPQALNIGIQAARGELVLIMSAHATYAPDAIAKLVAYSRTYGADNVGGMWRIQPRGAGLWDLAVAAALSHPFGVGNARYRIRRPKAPVWVDTAAYGCYRREVFSRIGMFNTQLLRGEDMEFNLRLKRAGGRTLLAPDVTITYYARSGFFAFGRHNFRNGLWVILPFQYADGLPVAARHLVPLAFAGAILTLGVAGLLWPPGWWLLGLLASLYALPCLLASLQVVVREGNPGLMVFTPFAFASLHLAYGLGSLWGVLRLLARIPARYLVLPRAPRS